MSTVQVTDYSSRVADLTNFCSDVYGIPHSQTRAMLACLMPVPVGKPMIRFICNTIHHPFWDQIGGALRACGGFDVENMAFLGVNRPRTSNRIIQRFLDAPGKPLILIDTAAENPHPKPDFRHLGPRLAASCIRLDVQPTWDKLPHLIADRQIIHYLERVLDYDNRPLSPVPIAHTATLSFATKLLTLANRDLTDIVSLSYNLRLVPAAHAVLFNRASITAEDGWVLNQVVRACIQPWVWRVLNVLNGKKGMRSVREVSRESGLPIQWAQKECERMAQNGLLDWPVVSRKRGRWLGIADEYRVDVGRVLSGDMELI